MTVVDDDHNDDWVADDDDNDDVEDFTQSYVQVDCNCIYIQWCIPWYIPWYIPKDTL